MSKSAPVFIGADCTAQKHGAQARKGCPAGAEHPLRLKDHPEPVHNSAHTARSCSTCRGIGLFSDSPEPAASRGHARG